MSLISIMPFVLESVINERLPGWLGVLLLLVDHPFELPKPAEAVH